MDATILPTLAPEALCWRCDATTLVITTTNQTAPLHRMIGHDRGMGAIEFGLSLEPPRANLYVAGPGGTGRSTAVRAQVEHDAAGRPARACPPRRTARSAPANVIAR